MNIRNTIKSEYLIKNMIKQCMKPSYKLKFGGDNYGQALKHMSCRTLVAILKK